MDTQEKLKLDYEQTTKYFHTLADIRFKLLALVPLATGAAIGLLSGTPSGKVVLAIGILGFLTILGITIYDQRNTQLYDAMQKRAKAIEALLKFEPLVDITKKCGGAFLDRPQRSRYLLGFILMWHDRGLAIIYSTSLAGWAYLITNGLVQILQVKSPITLITVQVFVPMVILILFLCELHRFDEPTDIPKALTERVRELVYTEGSQHETQ